MSMTPSSYHAIRFDESDADVTSQFLSAADATNVDLAPAGADATSEIDAIDIISVRTAADDSGGSDVLRTSKHERISVSGAAVRLLTPKRPTPAPSTTLLARTASRQPSSIAPLSLDVMAPRVAFDSVSTWSPLPTVSTTLELAGTAGIPRRSPRLVMFATTVAGLCLVAGAVGAVLGYERDSSTSMAVAATGTAFHAPRAANVMAAREEITISPPSAPEKASATPTPTADVDELADAPASPAPVVHAPIVTAPQVAVAAPAPHPAATGHGTTGILHVPGGAPGALVDGAPHRVENGQVVVACGHHRVKLPGRSVRNVEVPCGGSTTF